MNIYIADRVEEFRIEISGRFADEAVSKAGTAWKAALLVNTPRRISVDITRMTGYDRAGFLLLREMHVHGIHVAAGTPRSLLFFNQICGPPRTFTASISDESIPQRRGPTSTKNLLTTTARAAAAGE